MKKIVECSSLAWDEIEALEEILGVERLPEFIIIEGIER